MWFLACISPEVPYHFDDDYEGHGWIGVNRSITYECSDDRSYHTVCVVDEKNTNHGKWEPEVRCPPMIGKCAKPLLCLQ